MRVLVTGSDTDAGKTYFSCALLRGARQLGWPARGIKIVETGLQGAEHGPDTLALAAAAQHSAICFAGYHPPLAPCIAAEAVSELLEVATLARWTEEVASPLAHERTSLVLAEGAGGLHAPLNRRHTFADLAERLAWPLIVVAPDRLGSMNHTLLTTEVARARGIAVVAIVLSETEAGAGHGLENAATIARHTGVPVYSLGCGRELAVADVARLLGEPSSALPDERRVD